VGMNQRGRLIEDLKRVQGRIHNWLDRFFPEFTRVFKDWEGKSALVCLHLFPLPTDVVKETEIEVVRKWRENGIKRGVGVSRARHLIKAATDSIGITLGLQMARQELQILLEQYDLLHAQLEHLIADIEQFVNQVPGAEQMMSVPGIGLVTTSGFIAEVGDISSYQHPRQIQKLAGLNLKENSSGSHKGKTQISKRGRPQLRALLFRCVIPLIAKNAEFQGLHQYFTQRLQNPLKKIQSVVALCCKLIRILFVLWKRQVPYDPKQMLGPVQAERLQNVA
jgi:transposase